MISFDELVGGLVGGKGGMGDAGKNAAKEKIMQHLEEAKKLADDSGIDFMSIAKECDGMDDNSEMASDSMPEKDMADNSDSVDAQDSLPGDSEMSPSGKSAKMSAIIMSMKKKKEA